MFIIIFTYATTFCDIYTAMGQIPYSTIYYEMHKYRHYLKIYIFLVSQTNICNIRASLFNPINCISLIPHVLEDYLKSKKILGAPRENICIEEI